MADRQCGTDCRLGRLRPEGTGCGGARPSLFRDHSTHIAPRRRRNRGAGGALAAAGRAPGGGCDRIGLAVRDALVVRAAAAPTARTGSDGAGGAAEAYGATIA